MRSTTADETAASTLGIHTTYYKTMAFVIGQLRAEITVPFGVNVLWDPISSIALAAATGAQFWTREGGRLPLADGCLGGVNNAGALARYQGR